MISDFYLLCAVFFGLCCYSFVSPVNESSDPMRCDISGESEGSSFFVISDNEQGVRIVFRLEYEFFILESDVEFSSG